MSSKIASSMKWHSEGRTKDGKMRHPADSPAWKTFDFQNPEFSKDPRNVRLGLATDGFNPFKNMNTTYSSWPVILMPYNLPPDMCMKQPFFMLSLLIPGPTEPGNNMDIYLQPLIAELNDLWGVGVNTFDASTNQTFNMRAALLWTISDLPGNACVSGWSTKGYLACPVCHKFTCSEYLHHSKKVVYMDHRRFLEEDHPYRTNTHAFNGKEEHRVPPSKLTGSMILNELDNFDIKLGKLVKNNPKLLYNWRKKSIFFELPYWEKHVLRHNLDVMHIEKNVCDNIIGTLLDLSDKTKDHKNARLDCQQKGVRPELHPNEDGSLPTVCFSLNKAGKENFCSILKKVKLPDGHASNISRCVQLKPPKIHGLKSHDSHILMQQLLPLCMRKTLPKKVRSPLINFCRYFRKLCSKELCPRELVRLEREIATILCELETIFPPSFFDVMVHLTIHLATEAKIGGPVHYRWMYPVERYLCTLKSYVRNRSRPEGSIAEGYLAQECMGFCSLYLSDEVDTRFNQLGRNEDRGVSIREGLDIFSRVGRPLGKTVHKVLDEQTLEKAHRYVLFNCDAVLPYISQHVDFIEEQHSRSRKHERKRLHSETFATWFSDYAESLIESRDDQIMEDIKFLARGPTGVGIGYKRYIINGSRFQTKEWESKRKTQNSGVVVSATTSSFSSTKDDNPISSDLTYYGVFKDIFELDYTGGRKVNLFECDWVSKSKRLKKDDDGFTLANFKNIKRHNEPFVLATQVKQVFYVEDPTEKGWHVVVNPKFYED